MNKGLKFIFGIVGFAYILVAIFVTVCLVKYNDYKISVFGDYSLLIIDDEGLKPNFNKGDLLIIRKNNSDEVKSGDYVFFYNTYEREVSVNLGMVVSKEKVNDTETTYVMEGKLPISSEFLIGKSDTTLIYSKVGGVLKVLESKYGFLGLVVLPILIMFLYEIYAIVKEIKNPTEDDA